MIAIVMGLLGLPLQERAPAPAPIPAATQPASGRQTCVSPPPDRAAAEAALASRGDPALTIHLIYYRSARAAGLPDCKGE